MAYQLGTAIGNEEDYYRNDMDAVRRCLRGQGEFRKAFTFVYGPRRCGKTSFLNRVKRHADEERLPCSFINFMNSLATITHETEAAKGQTDGLLLLDEVYSLWPKPQMTETALNKAQAKRAVCLEFLTEIAARNKGTVRCVIADVPMLMEALHSEGDSLDPVLSRSEPYYIDGFSINEAVSLVCQTKTNRDELLRTEAQRALEENIVSGLAMEVSMLGEYLAGGNILDRVGFANFLTGRGPNSDRILPDLSQAEQILVGLSYHQATTVRKDYLLPNALAEAESLSRFGLCRWVHSTDGQTFELRGTLLPCLIPKWNNSKANRPVAEIEREVLREVLTPEGIANYKGVDERQARTHWVVHHLSDIYMGRYSEAKPSEDRNDPIRVEYIKHIAALKPQDKPSIAVISGDLASVGSKKELKACKPFLEELRRSLIPLSRTEQYASGQQVVVVPGEHDQDWELFGQIVNGEDLLPDEFDHIGNDPASLFSNFQGLCEDYVTPPFGQRTPGEETEHPSAVYHKEARILIVPFNSAVLPSRRELGGKEHFKALVGNSIYDAGVKLKAALGKQPSMEPRLTPDDDAEPDVVVKPTLESELRFFVRNEVGVLQAAACKVGQIRTRVNSAVTRGGGEPDNTMLRIAVCHHNVHQQDGPLVDLVHAKRFKAALAQKGFSLVLHGHTHSPYSIHERPGSAQHRESTSLVTVAAASLGDTRIEMDNDDGSKERTKAGFNELVIRHVIDASSGLTFKVQVTAWEWDENKRQFEPGPLGEYTF